MLISDVFTVTASVVASVVSSLGAIALAAYLSRRISRSDERRKAYENFITAAERLTLRATLSREDQTFSQLVTLPTLNEIKPILAALLIGLATKASVSKWKLMKLIAESTQSVPPTTKTVSDELLLRSLEDMQQCWLKVRLVGSQQIIESGRTLMHSSGDLIEVLLHKQSLLPWKNKVSQKVIASKREAMKERLDTFIKLAREQPGGD